MKGTRIERDDLNNRQNKNNVGSILFLLYDSPDRPSFAPNFTLLSFQRWRSRVTVFIAIDKYFFCYYCETFCQVLRVNYLFVIHCL